MATALFMVRSTIKKAHEAAFNRWYDTEHLADVLAYPGAVSARRYRTILRRDDWVADDPEPAYIALYEFKDEDTLRQFLDSEQFARIKQEYTDRWGDVTTRERFAFVQVWP